MPLFGKRLAVGAVGDPFQGLFDCQFILAVDGVQQLVHIRIAGDAFTLGLRPIFLLASGKRLWRGVGRRSAGWSQSRGAIRIVPITQFQLSKRPLTTVHARLPRFCDAVFCFQLLFELDAQLTHGALNFLPGVRIDGHSGRTVLLIYQGRGKRLARTGRVLGCIGGAASGRHVQRWPCRLREVPGHWQRCRGIWCVRCLSLWRARLLIVALFCGDRRGERWRGMRGRRLGQVRVRRLLGLLRRCILLRTRGLRRHRLLAAVQVRNLLLDFLRALFLRLLALRRLLRYVGCLCLRRLCQLRPRTLGGVIRG